MVNNHNPRKQKTITNIELQKLLADVVEACATQVEAAVAAGDDPSTLADGLRTNPPTGGAIP